MKKRVLMVSCEGLGNGGVQNVMMNIQKNGTIRFYLISILQRDFYSRELEESTYS